MIVSIDSQFESDEKYANENGSSAGDGVLRRLGIELGRAVGMEEGTDEGTADGRELGVVDGKDEGEVVGCIVLGNDVGDWVIEAWK